MTRLNNAAIIKNGARVLLQFGKERRGRKIKLNVWRCQLSIERMNVEENN